MRGRNETENYLQNCSRQLHQNKTYRLPAKQKKEEMKCIQITNISTTVVPLKLMSFVRFIACAFFKLRNVSYLNLRYF